MVGWFTAMTPPLRQGASGCWTMKAQASASDARPTDWSHVLHFKWFKPGNIKQQILPTPQLATASIGFRGTKNQGGEAGASTESVFARLRTKFLWLLGFLAVFAVIVATAWSVLDMGQAPVPRQPIPDLTSNTSPPPDASLNDISLADTPLEGSSPVDAPPSDSSSSDTSAPVASLTETSPEVTPAPATKAASVVHRDRVSTLFATGRARAVRSGAGRGSRLARVEFLTSRGRVSEAYPVSTLSNKGWKVASNGRMAVASKGEEVYRIPIVNPSSTKSRRNSDRAAGTKSKIQSTGDHLGVGYMRKLP
jgi:hypothetical protein